MEDDNFKVWVERGGLNILKQLTQGDYSLVLVVVRFGIRDGMDH